MRLKRATIIYNPTSGRSWGRLKKISAMTRLLRERGVAADVGTTHRPNDGAELARRAIAAGAEIIIAFGGDGTLNEVLQGMVGTDASLVVWAGGTENVAARDLGMPFSARPLADVIAAGHTRRISLGLVKTSCNTSPGRYFFMFAGIGLDASICRGVNPELKKRTGQFAFVVSGIKELIDWRPEPFTVEVEGKTYESGFSLVGNGKGYGGGILMTPSARLEDPWFEVFILPAKKGRLGVLLDMVKCRMGKPWSTDAKIIKTEQISANSNPDSWVEVDGEVLGPLPAIFRIVPQALSVIVP
ncbi:MAG TPA: YegS/Rv2252/BmrU family lipid kinase [Blastocatellia bacterium]